MVFTLAVAAADGCQYGCLYPSEGIVSVPVVWQMA